MYTYILVALITLVDGSPLADLPLQMYDSKEMCMEQAYPPHGSKHVDKIRIEWEIYKQDHAETRDIDTVALTCDAVVVDKLYPQYEKPGDFNL
jgi:hypothetical protein|tara:strand:- start:45 stop:323 length:279 start_codon:yes stop_codon:yes gene_type:complete